MPEAISTPLTRALSNISLDAAGLVVLADLTTVARRTALTGTTSLLDVLVLAPGLHRQQAAPDLNGGEYPACAAMTTGYVFRVENPATVLFLQKVGRAGQLTTLSVTSSSHSVGGRKMSISASEKASVTASIARMAYLLAVSLTLLVMTIIVLISSDLWGLLVFGTLFLTRFINVAVIRSRAAPDWKGASEPGVQGDLLVLLSQDRWVRVRGAVDDLKAVTSGQWLRDMSFFESSLVSFATLLVYLDAALVSNALQSTKILLLVLLFCSAGLLGIANEFTAELKMHGRTVRVQGPRRKYFRRLEMAEQLIEETGRRDWAVRLGMVPPKTEAERADGGPPIM